MWRRERATGRHGGEWRDEYPTPRPGPRAARPGWLNTEGDVSLRGLRGRFVLLDFWTFCCVNCLHVIDELRPLEERYADELVVVGVHSPKFVHEADPVALAQAVERYSVHHAVLDDPELVTWQAYTARAWPTLVLVDPEGYVVAQYAGEGHVHAIDALLGELVEEHRAGAPCSRGDSPYVAPPVEPTDLRFPAKAVPLPGGGALVADAGHDEVVELAAAGEVVRALRGVPRAQRPVPAAGRGRRRGGVRRRGRRHRPPPAARHRPRAPARCACSPATAPSGCRATAPTGSPSPWDVAWWQDRVWVAMAGIHQLWTFDPRTGDGRGGGRHHQRGPARRPGRRGVVRADLRAGARRRPALDRRQRDLVPALGRGRRRTGRREVHTAVGTGLFDFGFRDGAADQALLQHPLGVTVLPDGTSRSATPTTARSGASTRRPAR